MKIEMGESLMQSWLKHTQNCKITQLNWKPSTNWTTYNKQSIEELYKRISTQFPVFKNNANYEQVIKQAELDVLGLSYDDNNNMPYYYAIDIAYHESGLNYGSKEETIERISKKLLRSSLVLYHYFNVKNGEIIFASPKINSDIYRDLEERIKEINKFMCEDDFMRKHDFEFKFELFANERFTNEILIPTVEKSSSVSDTAELFMRAFQLINLCEKKILIKNNI